MALEEAAKHASSSVSLMQSLVAGQHPYHQFCWNLPIQQNCSQMVMERMETAMQMVRFTCRVFAQLNLYQLYDVFRYLCIDETDFHVQSLDSGTTEGVERGK